MTQAPGSLNHLGAVVQSTDEVAARERRSDVVGVVADHRTTSTAPRGCEYFVEHDIFFRHSRKSSQCHHVLASVGARRELPPTRCNNDSISVPEVPHGVT